MVLLLIKSQLNIFRDNSGQWLTPILLYLLICCLFPLTVPLGTNIQPFATGILWVGLLLSAVLAIEVLFRSEFDSGFLEQIMFSNISLWQWVLVKTLTQWVFTLVPILLLIPVISMVLSLPASVLPLLAGTVAVGSLGIYLLGSIGAALVVAIPSAGLLLAFIILPFYIPILIFAVSSVNNVLIAVESNALLWLCCCSLLALIFAPFATAACLKLQLSN